MLVYFAHPIDQATQPMRVINEIRGALNQAAVSFYRPAAAFTLNHATMPDLASVQLTNVAAQFECDALLAWLPSGVPTLGVPAEIERSISFGKPTVILTDGDLIRNSVQMNAWRDRGATVIQWPVEPAALLPLLRVKPNPPVREMVDASTFAGPAEIPGQAVLGSDPGADLLWTGDGRLTPGKYVGDAGIDLATSAPFHIDRDQYMLVPTGVKVAIPDGYFGWITGRSSTWAQYQCQIIPAIIDCGYRGELMIGVRNFGPPINFRTGMRLAQMILLPSFQGKITKVNQLPESHRGEAGYGSSGQ